MWIKEDLDSPAFAMKEDLESKVRFASSLTWW
ncbi:hypothetical protein J1605_012133 [Eschrichtius robustus]|uniref:Uncharacterized protein n=1 Tax=Eschrichtius robustus TaxID=9764 RepID=A0AB34GLC6_ESCRO|nr:hypothetical protein J1605_012133 [Eschrichtius robustus]